MDTHSLTHVGTESQKAANHALKKFCSEHGCPPGWIARLETFAIALEQRDVATLKQLIPLFSSGTMGAFSDWVPVPANQNEDGESLECSFQALKANWLQQVQPLTDAWLAAPSGSRGAWWKFWGRNAA